MNNFVLPLVYVAAAVALRTASASMAALPAVNHPIQYVRYFQQDADTDVQPDPDSDDSYDVFYDQLAPQGHWFNSDDYGYVWQPNVAASESSWRPYSDGHWVWTDRGWFWQSNEDFGWATYHYGRWILVDGTGWVWVPGRQWAPAWVSWRHTDDDNYVGWAPLPPESAFNRNVGFHPWIDGYYGIGPTAFTFIRIGDFSRPSYGRYFVPAQESLGFFDRTRNITNINYNNNVINNYGPQYQRVSQLVQQRGGQQLPNYRINYAAQTRANSGFSTSVEGNQLHVLAPPQILRPISTVKPQVGRELGKAQVNRGWRDVPETQAQQLRQKFAQENPVPKDLPAKPAPPPRPQFQEAAKGGQHPAGEPGKNQETPPGQLKPFVEQPGNKTSEEQKRIEAEKARTVQPENVKPGGPPRKPPVATEEKTPGTEPTEIPKTGELRKGEGPQGQQNLERHAQEAAKPEGHEPAPKRKKVETKKEPAGSPQANANRQGELLSHSQPHVAEAHTSQPHPAQPHVAETHVSQPHPAQPHVSETRAPQPHVAQAPHPKSPPPQARRTAPGNNQKKKGEHKE